MNRFYHLFIFAFLLILASCGQDTKRADFSSVEKGFINPPDTVQTSIYWYWISDNISKEAVVKDLHSMKQVGINRAFIGNIGLSAEEAPYGKVKLFSDEWWEIMHVALKTATELNIELGIFNSPGWSQSGGPWVKPSEAMRYLASTEIRVKGPQKFVQKLQQPTSEFQDVKVVAWPVSANQVSVNLLEGKSQFKLSTDVVNIVSSLKQPMIARGMIVYPTKHPIRSECELQVKDGDNYKTVHKFIIDRTNPALNVGFEPYAPIAVSFPEVESKNFRVVFTKSNQGCGIEKILLSSTPVVERYAEKSLAKMFQSPLPYWHDYLWPTQPEVKNNLVPAPESVKDISKHLAADGTLTWDVPEGEWIIMRTGMTPTGVTNAPAAPEGTGYEVDKMSKQHVAAHFNAFLGKIIERVPAADRKTWKVVVQDSYETGGQNFTDDFLNQFQERYGYDPVQFLPVFKGHVVGSPDLSDRFLWDVRRMVADKVSYDYVAGLREVSHKHGLTTWLENYGHWGFPGEFLQYGGQSDEIGGEFWSEGTLGDIENRAASSCAHIYGKTKVSAESFTCGGGAYSRYPATMKRRGDWSFTEGINNTLLHVYIQQPYEDKVPGVNTWFGNEFNRFNTWYSQMDLFVTYLKRSNFMLQQGLNVADVAYFIGEDAPKMTGVRDPEIPKGYSFDYINAEIILRDLQVKNGCLVLPHGTSYKMMVLPKLETMRPEVLAKIQKLVADGAVILGPAPKRSPSMENHIEADKKIQTIAAEMWGDMAAKQRSYGKGTILTNMTMVEAFSFLKLAPDCLFGETDPALYVHRNMGGNDIYFITNQSDQTITLDTKFRVQGAQPELWDAVTGAIRVLPSFTQNGEITSVPLKLEAYESAFIVFRKDGKPTGSSLEGNYPATEMVATLNKPWEVKFESSELKRGPAEPVVFKTLTDWANSDNDAIKYYSGSAVYKTTFTVDKAPASKQLFLDLGKVSAMAKVKVNGEYVGGVWTAPYRLDVTKYVKDGDNTLEVEVVNTWVNRLIGDKRLPEKERRTWSHNNPWQADTPPHSSGLLGPVSVYSVKY